MWVGNFLGRTSCLHVANMPMYPLIANFQTHWRPQSSSFYIALPYSNFSSLKHICNRIHSRLKIFITVSSRYDKPIIDQCCATSGCFIIIITPASISDISWLFVYLFLISCTIFLDLTVSFVPSTVKIAVFEVCVRCATYFLIKIKVFSIDTLFCVNYVNM